MNRYLAFSLAISMTLGTLAIPLRAANKPRAGGTVGATVVWRNEDLERLRTKGPISVVGQVTEQATTDAEAPSSYVVETQDPDWYAGQASKLRAELESREVRLQHYCQALEDAKDLKTVTGGINHDGGDIGITPDAMASRRARCAASDAFVRLLSKQCYVGASRSFAGTDGNTLRRF